MDKKTLNGVCAVLLGALIGTMVALELDNHFWWLGSLLGGVISWLACDLKSAITAIPVAWRLVTNWRFDTTPIKMFGALMLLLGMTATAFVIWFSPTWLSIYSIIFFLGNTSSALAVINEPLIFCLFVLNLLGI